MARGIPKPVEQLAEALRENRGMVATAARQLGMNHSALCARIKDSPTLQAVVAEAREHMTDRAELKLYEKVEDGESWAVTFYLRTQGKSRGYVERQEVTGANGDPLAVKHSHDFDFDAFALAFGSLAGDGPDAAPDHDSEQPVDTAHSDDQAGAVSDAAGP